MMIIDDLRKGSIPTIPTDLKDPPRFAQPVETTKDVFTLELQKYTNRQYQTASLIAELPTIKKYDISTNPNESSLETAVRLIQKHPGAVENLPLVAILGAVGRNRPISMNNQTVAVVAVGPSIVGTIAGPFVLTDGMTILYTTVDERGNSHDSTIILRTSRFTSVGAATVDEVIAEINFQALYAHGTNSAGKVEIGFHNLQSGSTGGDIKITGGTALSVLGFTINQQALHTDIIPYRRYIQATNVDVAIEVATEDENTRTELTDLVWAFFTIVMNDRRFTFYGRSTYDSAVTMESYQITIKPDLSMAGEQEVPRPNSQLDKVYVNRINIPVLICQYVDKAVLIPGTTTPFYLNGSNVQSSDLIPMKQ